MLQPTDIQTLARLTDNPIPSDHVAKQLLERAIEVFSENDQEYGIISYMIDQVEDYRDNQELWEG